MPAPAAPLACPHCHSPVEWTGSEMADDILCPACGSTFRVGRPGSTADWAGGPWPKTIGPFEVVGPVGTGAFGSVFKARDRTLDRVVAIKIPRADAVEPGRDGVDRFLREARSTAQLRHPAVVPVHEVGTHDGRPYIVSEFIDGVTLAEWLTAKQPTFRQAGELVAELADALHAAHALGVVHRDVKPSNVLMDAAGRPHLTDFGLAKRDAGEATMTVEGQVLGTPAYMSPEQARGQGHAVDGRSDEYSLGVILYQLLTGEPPFRGSVRMLLHQVLHDEPRPPRKFNDQVPRDLETICLKCLAKEPARRYPSCADLAADVRRWLANRPILARPAGRLEKGWRWCRRNPGVAALSAALAIVVVTALAGLTGLYLSADAQRRRAETAEAEQRQAADDAAQAAATARQEGAKARQAAAESAALATFFQTKVLAAARPKGQEDGQGIDTTLRDLLVSAGKSLDKDFTDQPALAASLHHAIGSTYYFQGEFALAKKHWQRAADLFEQTRGPDDPNTLKALSNVGVALRQVGLLKEAEKVNRELLARRRRALGPDHPDTYISVVNLAYSLIQLDQFTEAEGLFREGYEGFRRLLGPGHANTLAALSGRCELLIQMHRYSEAEAAARRLLDDTRASLGPTHPESLRTEMILADLFRQEEDWAAFDRAAVPDLVARMTKGYGPRHANTLFARYILAQADLRRGRAADAERELREILPLQRQATGQNQINSVEMERELIKALASQGKWAEARPMAEALLRRANTVTDGPNPRAARLLLARVLNGLKEYKPAESLARDGRDPKPADPATVLENEDAYLVLAESLAGQSRFAEAETVLSEAWGLRFALKSSYERLRTTAVAVCDGWGRPERSKSWRERPVPTPAPGR